jgi:hypothetical protein
MVTIKEGNGYSIYLRDSSAPHTLSNVIPWVVLILTASVIGYMNFSEKMYPLSAAFLIGCAGVLIFAVLGITLPDLWRVPAYDVSAHYNATPLTRPFREITIKKGKPAVDQLLICNAARELEAEILILIVKEREEYERLKEIAGKCK